MALRLPGMKAERFDRAMAPVRDTIDDVIDQTRLLSDIILLVYNANLAEALPTSMLERHKELIAENVGLALSLSTENENLLTSLNAIGDAQGPDDLVEKLAAARMEAQQFAGPIATAVISGLDDMAIEAGVLEQVMSRVSGQGERLAAAFQNAQAESFLFSRRFADEEALMNMPLTVDPRNRPSDTPPRRTGGGGRATSTADKQAAALKKLTDGLQLEIELLGELDPVNQEMLKLRGQLKGATEAETEAVRALIETRNEERDALDQHISQLDNWRDGARSIFDMIVEGARQGTSAVDILLNVLFDLGSKLTSMAGDSLIDALFGSSGSADGGAIGGGLSDFFGSIFKFADGDVFDSPTLFGFGNGQLGVMGEAGREGVVPLEHSFGEGIGVQIGDRETALPLTSLKSGKLGAAIQPFANGGAFGGIASSHPTASQSASFAADITRLAPMLDDLHDRLSGVVIECLPYADVIRRYDRPSTLFYLDPPYWGNEGDYGKVLFHRADFATLAKVLSTLSGRFIMSLNDRPEVRETFQSFKIEPVKTTYTIAAKSSKKVGEVIISN